MATIGMELYATAVHEFFYGLRSYDVARAVAALADDADFASPWNEGKITGKEAIQSCLEGVVGDAKTRPSFTIRDISGDGNLVHLEVSESGRFGEKPVLRKFHCLHVQGKLHQVVIQ